MRSKILIGLSVVILALCGCGGFFGYKAFNVGKDELSAAIDQQQFDAQALGGSESNVRQALPKPSKLFRDDTVYGKGDADQQGRPSDSSCVYYGVKPRGEGNDQALYRFCFRNGTLLEKKRIQVKS